MEKTYTIGEISKIYHIGLDSIRYYEKIGLIHPKRAENNYRYYDKDDIYRLNIIRDLLELGFTSKDILSYFDNRKVSKTYDLLKKEKDYIDKNIERLKLLKDNVDNRLQEIRQIKKIEFEKVIEKNFETRKYFILDESYEKDSDMDILIHMLGEKEKDKFYIIGNNQIGTIIPKNHFISEHHLEYKAVFVISKNGDHILPKGKYLSILYKGDYKRTSACIEKLIAYATANNYKIVSDFLEIIWIDIHATDDKNEYVTEVQVMVN